MTSDTALKKRAMRFVLITVFIYSAGFGIIMPALPNLIQELEGISLSEATRLGAWIGATYAIFQFALGPMVGNLGDRFGRRPVFLVSLFAFAFDFLLMGMAPAIIWLFIGRGVAGGLGAIFGPANAAMADMSDEKDRAASFGKVGAAFGIGFIIGPAMGGFLADAKLLLWLFSAVGLDNLGQFAAEHSTRVPFFFAAAMAFANFIYGWFVFPETMPKEKQRPFELHRANPLGALASLGKVRSVLPIALVYFLWSFAGQIYPASWSFFAQAQYGWDTATVGLSLTAVGISMALSQAMIIGRAVARFGERLTAQIGMIFAVLGFVGFAFITNGTVAFLLCFLMGLQGIAQPSLNAMMSRRIPTDQQGELQGFNGSMAALAFLLAQLIFNFTLAYFTSAAAPVRFPGAPFVIAAIFATSSLIILTLLRRSSQVSKITRNMAELSSLSACDTDAIETLLDAAFGADRKRKTAYMLRQGVDFIDPLSFALISDKNLTGSIQCWPVRITEESGETTPLILVGPVAIDPEAQRQGHGHTLMRATLNAAMLEGNPPMVMVGDEEYYGRFGFSAKETAGWHLPGPWETHRLLLRNEGDYILPLSGIIGADVGN